MQKHGKTVVDRVNYLNIEYPRNYHTLTSYNDNGLIDSWLSDINEFPSFCNYSREHLLSLAKDELEHIYQTHKNYEQQLINRLDNAHPFYSTESEANYNHWKTIPKWTVYEATLLSFGKDPNKINELSFAKKTLPIEIKFHERFKQINQAANSGAIGEICKNPKKIDEILINPKDFIEWCDKVRLELPSTLKECFNKITSSNPLNAHERNSQSKMIIGLMQWVSELTGTPISRLIGNPLDNKREQPQTLEMYLQQYDQQNNTLSLNARTIREHYKKCKTHLGVD